MNNGEKGWHGGSSCVLVIMVLCNCQPADRATPPSVKYYAQPAYRLPALGFDSCYYGIHH